MIREVPDRLPNRSNPSPAHGYFKLAIETPNEFLMIPCNSPYRATVLAKKLRNLNVRTYDKKFEIFKRDDTVYMKRKYDELP